MEFHYDKSDTLWVPLIAVAGKVKGHIYCQFESNLACTEMRNAKGIWVGH